MLRLRPGVVLVALLFVVAPGARAAEHAVIVDFENSRSDWSDFFAFEPSIDAAVAAAGVGEYDGNELAVDGSDGTLYFYGPDADRLFAVVRRVLLKASFMRRAVATVRYGAAGDPRARSKKVELVSAPQPARKTGS